MFLRDFFAGRRRPTPGARPLPSPAADDGIGSDPSGCRDEQHRQRQNRGM